MLARDSLWGDMSNRRMEPTPHAASGGLMLQDPIKVPVTVTLVCDNCRVLVPDLTPVAYARPVVP